MRNMLWWEVMSITIAQGTHIQYEHEMGIEEEFIGSCTDRAEGDNYQDRERHNGHEPELKELQTPPAFRARLELETSSAQGLRRLKREMTP